MVVRRGRKTGTRRLVMYVLGDVSGPGDQAKVGFIVSKAVGNSVVRHRVSRRLRHVVRDRLSSLPDGYMVAVRALPAARDATSAELGDDVDKSFRRLHLAAPGPGGVRP